MSTEYLKIFEAFAAAKRVNHYYWMHTDGDDHQHSTVSIENIQKVIEIMVGETIEKKTVLKSSRFHRAFVERFNGGKENKIYVTKGEPLEWQRFSVVKELCHILIDKSDDFQADPCITIEGMTSEPGFFVEGSANETDSEQLAEMIAMELIYPLEDRRADLASEASFEQIALNRCVPDKYVYRGLEQKHFELCEKIWNLLPPVDPPNLNDKF